MITLRLTPRGILLQDLAVDLLGAGPATITESLKVSPRVTRTQYNDIYTWDEVGIYAHCKPGTDVIHNVSVSFAKQDYVFAPTSTYAGALSWGVESFDLGKENAQYVTFVKKEAKTQARKVKDSVDLELGHLQIYVNFDKTKKRATGVSVSRLEVPAEPAPMEPPSGKGVTFADFNFKLMVLQELMYRRKVLAPRFDVREFARRYKKRAIDVDDDGYEIIPEVRVFFEKYPVPAELLVDIEALSQDGGDAIYLQLCPFWDGEDEAFNVRSADDAALLPKLKRIVLLSDDEGVVEAFRRRGIEARFR